MRSGVIYTVLFICLIVFPVTLSADNYCIQWADTVGSQSIGNDAAVTFWLEPIVTGYLDTGSDDYLTTKYSADGSVLWTDTINADIASQAWSVAVDNLDNVIVAGGLTTADGDYYTVKYNPDGTILWADTLDNGSGESAQGVAVNLSNGRIFVTGSSGGDYFTVVYNANGTILATRTLDITSNDYCKGIAVDNSGNFIIVGTSQIGGGWDYITIKYNSSGVIQWVDTLDYGSSEWVEGVATDLSNNIIVTGYSGGDILTVKYDPNGDTIWTRTIDNGSVDRAYDVAVDVSNNIIVTGSASTGSENDFYTVKYDSNGTVLWSDIHDNAASDVANGVAVDFYGDIIVTGYSNIGMNRFYTVKYAYFDSLNVFIPEPESLNANGTDSTMVRVAVYRWGDELSGVSGALNFSATLGSFYGDVIEDADSTYYQWYRAGSTVGIDTIWVYCGNDSAMTIIYLVDAVGPVIAWWDSLSDDTSSVPEDTLFGPYPVQAEIYDDIGDISSSWLYWNTDSVQMNVVNGDTFSAEIPQQVIPHGDSLIIDYYIKTWDVSANLTQTEIRTFGIYHYDLAVEENQENQSLPKVYGLANAYPNPAKGHAIFKYQLPKASKVVFDIFNTVGRLVKRFDRGIQEPGYYDIQWNDKVASGVYFYRLSAGDYQATKKIVIME